MSDRVNVYDESGNVIARVKYNENLDIWDVIICSEIWKFKLGITKISIYGTGITGVEEQAGI